MTSTSTRVGTSRRSGTQPRRAWVVNPVRWVLGPTFNREMRVAGRKPWTYLTRGGYVLMLLAISVIGYSMARAGVGSGSGVAQLQAIQGLAPGVTTAVVVFQFVLLGFMAPSLTGGLINDEKRNRTLPALLTTPLSAAEIVLGKLTSRVVLLGTLLALSAPILLAVRTFGGVEASLVLEALAVSAGTAVFAASLGLMFSVWTRKSSSASGLAQLVLLIVNLAPVAVALWFRRRGLSASSMLPDLWSFCSPAVIVRQAAEIVDPGTIPPPSGTLGEPWVVNTVFNLGLASVASLITIASFRRSIRAEHADTLGAPEDDDTDTTDARSTETPNLALVHDTAREIEAPAPVTGAARAARTRSGKHRRSAQRRARTRSRMVGHRPVLWRELRQRTFRSKARLIVVMGVVAVLAIIFYSNTDMDVPESYFLVGVMGILGLAAQMAASTTSTIANEREARTWETLLTAPVSGREILLAKLAGTSRQAWFVPAIIIVHLGVLGSVHAMVSPIVVAHLLMISAGLAMLLAGTGLLLGLFIKRGSVAGATNMFIAMAAWVGVPMAAGMLTIASPSESQGLWTAIVVPNPVTLAGTALEGGIADLPRTTPGLSDLIYTLPFGELGVVGFTLVVLGTSLAGALLGLFATLYAGSKVRAVSGRRL